MADLASWGLQQPAHALSLRQRLDRVEAQIATMAAVTTSRFQDLGQAVQDLGQAVAENTELTRAMSFRNRG